MKHRMLSAILLLASPAALAAAPRMIVGEVGQVDAGGMAPVEIVFLNDGPGPYLPPDAIAATLATGDERVSARLDRAAGAAPPAPVAAGGFAVGQYAVRVPAGHAPGAALAVLLPEASPPVRTAEAVPEALALEAAPVPLPVVAAKPERGNAFLGNISAYAPIYAVYGPGTKSDARLQLSLKYQLFGTPGAVGRGMPWENGIHLGFTQRMFWNLGAESSPFRSIDFMPEAFYLVPARPVAGRVTLGGQAGFRHESNGRGGLDSRSLNTIYVQPVATLPVGAYTLSVGPRLWFYVGSLEDNPDIKRYRGNSGLFAEIGQDDGFRLTATGRMHYGTGRGAIDAELSYPLEKIVDTGLNLYVFGQAFTGYGENLFDYNRRVSRVRFGIGIVR